MKSEANGEETVSADVPLEHRGEKTNENVPVEHHSTNANNFVITDENLGVKTPKARFAANAAAIRTHRESRSSALYSASD